MKRTVIGFAWLALVLEMLVYYWFQLPALSIYSLGFWIFLLQSLGFAWLILLFSSPQGLVQKASKLSGRNRQVETYELNKSLPAHLVWLGRAWIFVILALMVIGFANSRIFRAKDYANVVTVQDADFKEDFPETDISKLALLDRASAEKIGDTYLGTIDKVSQFGISDDYRQITIGQQPYRVSPLEYKSIWKWISNHQDGIEYYVKVNQTTGKAELAKLSKAMHYSDSEYLMNDTMRHLRFQYPTTIFGKPSFEVDDEGNPYYIATIYQPQFGLSSNDPVGAVVLDAVTGESKRYDLADIPEWVDRVYSATNVISRVDDHYTYQNGFWNTIFSQTGVKNTTDSYNYITIGSDIYLYTGITSATADSSNLGFILVNMRTRQITNYKLASATETAAQESAEGEVQEKGYQATAPSLVKFSDKAYYLVSLKDDAGLVKTYALVDAEDYQQVTVNNDLASLISQVSGSDASSLAGISSDGSTASQDIQVIEGTIEALGSQMIGGTTVYYLQSQGTIYKVKASEDATDQLPFMKVGDQFTGQLAKNNYLNQFTLETK
ncbi:hypothetical protein HCC70_06465 [Streptococcus suis]|uniref:Cell shape-determining protein n=1 Tax=Streptococcus suivaginalis TaxID=3028082 RepID=A0AA97A085_9STRE|nr:hypothetical protein [Streptococcus sp. 29896]MCK4027975.1 hypothetical protein [Streptococcus suis]WNY46430.1 hypothetical protein PXH68_05910 [Streptococcus sp. 29896]